MSSKSMRFINRNQEVEEANDVLHKLQQGLDPEFPIREYIGIGGIGKSALLQALWENTKELNLLSAYIDLSTVSALQGGEFVSLISRELLVRMPDISAELQISLGLTQESSLDDFSKIVEALAPRKAAFFFDSFDKINSTITEALGSVILLALSASNNLIFFITNRERTNWGSYRYQLWRKTKSIELKLFGADAINEQLAGTKYNNLSDQILSITQGHPKSTNVVVYVLEEIERLEVVSVLNSNFGDFEARLIKAVLENAKRDCYVSEEDFNKFYLLSVLRYIDVTVPRIYLDEIDNTIDWNRQPNVSELLHKMQESSLLAWDPINKHYVINDFIRPLFSLYMRVFEPEKYINLSKAALKYYEDLLRNSLDSSSPDIRALVEKTYHSIDLLRLTTPRSFDIQIGAKLRKQLLHDLELTIPGGAAILRGRIQPARIQTFKSRVASLESLKHILEDDIELHRKLGDLGTPTPNRFLSEVVREYEQEFYTADPATIEIVRSPQRNKQGESEVVEYTTAFISGRSEPISHCETTITLDDRNDLLRRLQKRPLLDDIRQVGKWIFKKFLKHEVGHRINEHLNLKNPLTISVDDTEIPWELMHDEDDFISIKVPFGKLFRTAEPRPPSFGSSENAMSRCLLVGVPDTRIAGFRKLDYVRPEIDLLIDLFSNRNDIEFAPGKDVLFGDEATGMALEEKLLSGMYRIIHFAGHAYFKDNSLEDSKAGLVMYNRLVSLEDIKNFLTGRPFVFLNACQTAYDKNTTITVGYAGSYTLGIASAFMRGGALGCIGNIWPVVDKNALNFTRRFYDNLLPGKNLGEALRSAKEHYRMNDHIVGAVDDLSWIGYVLYGDPTQKLPSSSINPPG